MPENDDSARQVNAIKRFSREVIDNFKHIIKTIWLLPADELSRTEDITAVIIIDDMQDIKEHERKKLDALAHEISDKTFSEYGIKIHRTYYDISEYWDLIRHGSPVTFQEIRDGIPVYDPAGFFVPLKMLIKKGKIPGTKEAMRKLISKAPLRLKRIRKEFMASILENTYSAVVDAGQAPLVMAGHSPPTQKKVAETLAAIFVKKGDLEPEYVRYADEIIRYWKDYEHGKIKDIKGENLDRMLENSGRFIRRMEDLMEDICQNT